MPKKKDIVFINGSHSLTGFFRNLIYLNFDIYFLSPKHTGHFLNKKQFITRHYRKSIHKIMYYSKDTTKLRKDKLK